MNNINCKYCFEKNCICIWVKCSECGNRIPESNAMEYRGRIWCEDHNFEEQVAKRDFERKEVMETTEAAVNSQRKGEFVNNRGKYHLGNIAADGLPIIHIKENFALRKYEGR